MSVELGPVYFSPETMLCIRRIVAALIGLWAGVNLAVLVGVIRACLTSKPLTQDEEEQLIYRS